MKPRNEKTGCVLSIPPPDELGASTITLNGKVLHHLLFTDDGQVILGDGRIFKAGDEFAKFIVKELEAARKEGA